LNNENVGNNLFHTSAIPTPAKENFKLFSSASESTFSLVSATGLDGLTTKTCLAIVTVYLQVDHFRN